LAETPRRQVREWKAREDGLGAGRGKSLERQNPKGAADRSRRKNRGRLTDSQREQSPGTESEVTYREFIRRIPPPTTVGGQRPRMDREVRSRYGSRPERDSESRPSERKRLRRVNPKSGFSEQSGTGREWIHRQGRRNVEGGSPSVHTRTTRSPFDIRCRGTKPQESRGDSQGLPQLLRVKP